MIEEIRRWSCDQVIDNRQIKFQIQIFGLISVSGAGGRHVLEKKKLL